MDGVNPKSFGIGFIWEGSPIFIDAKVIVAQ